MRYVFFISVILSISIAGGFSFTTNTKPYAYGEVSSALSLPSIPEVSPRPLSILFTGDVMLARRTETLMDLYGSDYPYKRLPHLRVLADNVVVNFEASLPKAHVHTPDLTFKFSVDSQHLPALGAAGVTHAGVSNNHSFDSGMTGFLETQETLAALGVTPFGDVSIATTSVALFEEGSTSVALVPLDLVDATLNTEQLAGVLTALPTTTYQVAFVHWGTEYESKHSAKQEAAAKALVALGFDAIIGHHPHVVQDIAVLSGVPVFYSLGNFIFDQYFSLVVQEGLLVQLSATPDTMRFTLLPHTSVDARTQPRLLEGQEKDLFLHTLAEMSTSTVQEMVRAGVILIPS